MTRITLFPTFLDHFSWTTPHRHVQTQSGQTGSYEVTNLLILFRPFAFLGFSQAEQDSIYGCHADMRSSPQLYDKSTPKTGREPA